MTFRIAKRSIVIAGHNTSVSLEDEFWDALKEIAGIQKITVSNLVSNIDMQRETGNLSSAIRLYVLDHHRTHMPAAAQDRPGDGVIRPAAHTAHRSS